MGFHLVEKVYANVTGTSPTAQAVLAFLAHKADDKGERKCFPAVESIMAATHFGHSSIANALNDLRERNLLTWTSGGRLKGQGGKALANEYVFHLPDKPATSCIHEVDNAYSTRRSKHTPRGGQCMLHEVDTISDGQPSSQPSVIGSTEAETADLKSAFENVAANWIAKRTLTEAPAREEVSDRAKACHAVVDEAMTVCGVDDKENRRIFSSTLARRDPYAALEIIRRFASELRAGEHKGLRAPAAQLNKILAILPIVI